jgi:hypothetical protein
MHPSEPVAGDRAPSAADGTFMERLRARQRVLVIESLLRCPERDDKRQSRHS